MTFAARHRVLSINIPYGVPTPAAALAPVSFLPGPDDLMKLRGDMVRLVASLITRNIDVLSNIPKWERPGHAYEEEMAQKSAIVSICLYSSFTMLCHGIFLIMS